MAVSAALTSSKTVEWFTPVEFLDLVRAVGKIGLDPCWAPGCHVTATRRYRLDKGEDGLELPWGGFGLIFCNPPYKRNEIGEWVRRGRYEADESIMLLPSRTDTAWFQELWDYSALCFWKGRLKFGGAEHGAPFPSVVAYHGPARYRFAEVFSLFGRIVFP